jgi:hypothetical protein
MEDHPSPTTPPPANNEIAEKARMDLASRLAMPVAQVRLVKIYADEFPPDNLGCPGPSATPQPIPARVSGEVMILEANGSQYTYHTRKNKLVFCGKTE